MYLFFDTETTGLPINWGASIEDSDNWPRLVELAYVMTDDNGNILDKQDLIIKPEGFIIPKEASDIHRITTEIALEKGIELVNALNVFSIMASRCDIIVAHNISFDEKIIGAELFRKKQKQVLDEKEKICTMKSTVEFCAISTPRGYKWPKLQELHEKLFGCQFKEAHNALADIEATVKCFFELKKRGIEFKN